MRQSRRGCERFGERVFERHPLAIHQTKLILQTHHAGEDGRAHGAGLEASALLVGPRDDIDGPRGLDPGARDGFERLEAADHAIGAVELAAARLAVEVASRHHGRRVRLPAGTRM